jgi:fructokinase
VIVVIGEILIDKFPNYERIGGAPFNFAYHLKMLGFSVRFITRVGDDRNGRRIVDKLKQSGFDRRDIQIDAGRPTGTVRVKLDHQGVPHFDICEDVAYDYLDLDIDLPPDAGAPKMIYFGTLLQRTDAARRQVKGFLKRYGDGAARFCDINMRPPHVNAQAVIESLRQADLLKLNQDELTDIQGRLTGPQGAADFIPWLMETFAIGAVALTRGSRGSSFFTRDGQISSPAVLEADVIDTVGAGDGFAAILAAGYLRGVSWAEILAQASRFAAHICRIPGAIPDDDAFYDNFRFPGKGYADGR